MDYSALKSLQKITKPTERRVRWIIELQQYNFIIEHKSEKKNQNADALLRLISETYIKEENSLNSKLFNYKNDLLII